MSSACLSSNTYTSEYVISEGTVAPGFVLPGLVDGTHQRVTLDEFVGRDVVILVFYPADFNPACGDESDLDQLDLFTMQKDVTVLAIGPDSLYSHAKFADEYDLHMPMLSDADHDVAEAYGVSFEDGVGQRLIERAVVVIDHDGAIGYTWSTQDLDGLPPIDAIKDAIADTGGDDTAFARYRIGHVHYTDGRAAFTDAMDAYNESEWVVARAHFERAHEEFEQSADHFDSAVRFVDDEGLSRYYDRSKEKATALWQATDWLGKSAREYASGRGGEGQKLCDDAERSLETARSRGDPIDPDDWPPDVDPDGEDESILQKGSRDVTLQVDIDDELDELGDGDGTASNTHEDASVDVGERGTGDESGGDTSEICGDTTTGEGREADTVDDAELEAIEAELAASDQNDHESDELEMEPTSMVDAPPVPSDADPAVRGAGGEGTVGDRDGDDERETGGIGDIDGDVGEADLEALAADLEATDPDDPSNDTPDDRDETDA